MSEKEDVLREAVTGYLKENVTALDGRIYPEAIPQNEKNYPAAAISRLFVDRKRSKLGLTGISESRISVSIVAPRKIEAVRAADQVEAVLTGFFAGQMGNVQVKSIVMTEQVDFWDDRVEKHQVSSDYLITHANEV